MSRQRHTLKQPDLGPGGPTQRIAVAEKLLKSKIYIISSSVGLNSKERMWWLYLKMSLTECVKSEIRKRLTVKPSRLLTKMAAECWSSYLTGIAPTPTPVSGSSRD